MWCGYFVHKTVRFFLKARLRRPQDGLFTGVIDALDTANNSYRITFDRTGLGTHSVADIDVLVCIWITITTVNMTGLVAVFAKISAE